MSIEYAEAGYPSETSLDIIRKWEIHDYAHLMDFVRDIWKYADWGWTETPHEKGGTLYTISTGGWSGNEDIIGALQDNQMFWIMCWQSARRGGHFEFQVSPMESAV